MAVERVPPVLGELFPGHFVLLLQICVFVLPLLLLSFRRDQVEELLARLLVIPEHTQHRRRDRLAVDLLHAAHHHAHVTGREGNC